MVTADVERFAEQSADVLEERDPVELVAVVGSTAIGVITAQSITDRVLRALDMPVNPETIGQFAVSIGVKTVVALGFGVLAVNLGSGLGMLAAAIAGIGALTSAGVDAVFGLLETAPADLIPFAPQQQVPAQSPAASATPTPATNGSGGGGSQPDLAV